MTRPRFVLTVEDDTTSERLFAAINKVRERLVDVPDRLLTGKAPLTSEARSMVEVLTTPEPFTCKNPVSSPLNVNPVKEGLSPVPRPRLVLAVEVELRSDKLLDARRSPDPLDVIHTNPPGALEEAERNWPLVPTPIAVHSVLLPTIMLPVVVANPAIVSRFTSHACTSVPMVNPKEVLTVVPLSFAYVPAPVPTINSLSAMTLKAAKSSRTAS